jgi:metacaspase-1
MSKYALLIGCNYVDTPSCTLRGCIDDIQNMKSMLVSNMGFRAENITMLRDDGGVAAAVPTKKNIIKELNNIIQKSENAAEIWIHYSGHGSQVVDKNHDEASGYDSCIVPADFMDVGFIIDDDLLSIVGKSKCPTLILMDSCHSGTVCDLPYSIEYVSGTTYRFTRNNTAAISNPKIFMLSGCKDSQTSADIYDEEQSQAEGAFTDSFLRALKKNGYKGYLTKIYADILNWLSSNGFSQKPIMSSSAPNPTWVFGAASPPPAVATTAKPTITKMPLSLA